MTDQSMCKHVGRITVARRPGVTECVTCGAIFNPDGTMEVRS